MNRAHEIIDELRAPPLKLSDLQEQIAQLTAAVGLLTAELVRRGESSARLLKPAEVAELFGYGKTKIYALIEAGAIPTVQLDDEECGGSLRIPLAGLQALILHHLESSPVVDREWLSKLLSTGASTPTVE